MCAGRLLSAGESQDPYRPVAAQRNWTESEPFAAWPRVSARRTGGMGALTWRQGGAVAEAALWAESSAVGAIEESQDVAIGAIFDGHGWVVPVAYARVSSSTGMVRMPAVCRSYSAKPG